MLWASGLRHSRLERLRKPQHARRGGANPVPAGGDVQLLVSAQRHARDHAAAPAPPGGGQTN